MKLRPFLQNSDMANKGAWKLGIPDFFWPQSFIYPYCRVGRIRPLANFEPFWYSRTFLKKFRKVENRAKKFPYFQAPKINCLRRDYPPLLVIFNSASVRVNYFLLLMVFLGKHAFFLWSKHEMFRWVGDIFGGIKMLTTYHRGYNSGQVL